MNYKSYLPFLLFFVFPLGLLAQTASVIRTDRPGQAIVPYTVGKSFFQIQSGIEKSSYSQAGKNNKNFNLDSTLKWGVSEKLELNTSVVYQQNGLIQNATDSHRGWSDLQAGLRYNLINKPHGLTPALGLQLRLHTDLVEHLYQTKRTAPSLMFSSHHELTSQISWTNNLGISYADGFDQSPHTTYVSNISFPITESFGSFVEIFGQLQSETISVNTDAGLAYLLTNNFQLDASVGYGDHDHTTFYFISTGLSYRADLSHR